MAKEGSIYRKGDYEYQIRGGKAYNFNVPKTPPKAAKPVPKPEKKAEVKKPEKKAEVKKKAEVAPEIKPPVPKKAEVVPTKPPVYTKDQPGSEAEAYRGPVPENERMRIALAPTKRELDAITGVTGLSRVVAGMGRGLVNRAARTEFGRRAIEQGKKLLEAPKPPPKPTPAGPRRLENANRDQKLLEYRPEPKPRVPPKKKPRKPTEGAGTLDYKNGGRIDGAAVRGKTKGRYC